MTELTTAFTFQLLEQQVAYAKQLADILTPPSARTTLVVDPSPTASVIDAAANLPALVAAPIEEAVLAEPPTAAATLVEVPSATEALAEVPSATEALAEVPSATEALAEVPGATETLGEAPAADAVSEVPIFAAAPAESSTPIEDGVHRVEPRTEKSKAPSVETVSGIGAAPRPRLPVSSANASAGAIKVPSAANNRPPQKKPGKK